MYLLVWCTFVEGGERLNLFVVQRTVGPKAVNFAIQLFGKIVGDGFFHPLPGTFGVDKRHHVHHLDLRIVQSRHGFHNNLFLNNALFSILLHVPPIFGGLKGMRK